MTTVLEKIISSIAVFVASIVSTSGVTPSSETFKNVFRFPWIVKTNTVEQYGLNEVVAKFQSVDMKALNANVALHNSFEGKSAFTGSVDFGEKKGVIRVDSKSYGTTREIFDSPRR